MKETRKQLILDTIKEKKIVKVQSLSEKLKVSEMTIRRDLIELEEMGLLKRLHGGATIVGDEDNGGFFQELSHDDKQSLNIELKNDIAHKIAEEINDNELVFLGAGTTIELVADLIKEKSLKIITNSLPLFMKFNQQKNKGLILIGGMYRDRTNSFVGTLANESLDSLRVQKAFIGVNAIDGNIITNYNEEEGITQQKILNNASIKYIVADHTKLDKFDFYHFYNLDSCDFLIVDNEVSEMQVSKYQELIKLI